MSVSFEMLNLMSMLFPGNGIWAVIWCVCNVVAYVMAILAMKKNNKMLIIPAIIISLFDVVVGVIQAVIAFVSLWIFS